MTIFFRLDGVSESFTIENSDLHMPSVQKTEIVVSLRFKESKSKYLSIRHLQIIRNCAFLFLLGEYRQFQTAV